LKNIDLFKTLLKINAVTFGGGYTIVPIIRDEFVKNKKIIDDDEIDEDNRLGSKLSRSDGY